MRPAWENQVFMAARSLWNGAIRFGLVNVPIKVYGAASSKQIRFRELHVREGAPLEHRRVCAKEDKEIPYDEVVRGYETSPGRYVVMTKEDEELDLMALVEEASLGKIANIPEPTASRNADAWVDAETAGIPQRQIPAQPWTPRPPGAPAKPEPAHVTSSSEQIPVVHVHTS